MLASFIVGSEMRKPIRVDQSCPPHGQEERERNRDTRNKPSFRGTSLSDLLPSAKPSFGCSLSVNSPVD